MQNSETCVMKVKTIIEQDVKRFDKLVEEFYNEIPDENIEDEHFYSSSFGFARQNAIPGFRSVPGKSMIHLDVVTVFMVTFIYNETKAGENSKLVESKVIKA